MTCAMKREAWTWHLPNHFIWYLQKSFVRGVNHVLSTKNRMCSCFPLASKQRHSRLSSMFINLRTLIYLITSWMLFVNGCVYVKCLEWSFLAVGNEKNFSHRTKSNFNHYTERDYNLLTDNNDYFVESHLGLLYQLKKLISFDSNIIQIAAYVSVKVIWML